MRAERRPASVPIETPATWARLLAGLIAVFSLFQAAALAFGSDRGEAGLAVAAIVIAALVAADCALFRQSPRSALRLLGLSRPAVPGIAAALGLSVLLLLVMPVYAGLRGASLSLYPGWPWLIPGLFAQAGIAEEILFRGYLYRHLRDRRSFWHAAALSAAPFTLVHLSMFASMPWSVALAAVLLAAVISFPLAQLFEIGGKTIWAPAILHFTAQGAIKVLEIPGDSLLPLVWMAAIAAIPYLAFLVRRPGAQL